MSIISTYGQCANVDITKYLGTYNRVQLYFVPNIIITFLSPPPGTYASFLASTLVPAFHSSFLFSIFTCPPPGLWLVFCSDPTFDRTTLRFGDGADPTCTLFIGNPIHITKTTYKYNIVTNSQRNLSFDSTTRHTPWLSLLTFLSDGHHALRRRLWRNRSGGSFQFWTVFFRDFARRLAHVIVVLTIALYVDNINKRITIIVVCIIYYNNYNDVSAVYLQPMILFSKIMNYINRYIYKLLSTTSKELSINTL